ncbi:hypothetical protein PG994_003496 [Apiospora phragmitis]|uniref:Uncharacterized protein n=1 Tax=Apiospora phragmitis TaxID=2905665 RepID=A0ABR1VYD0_9PEZI
MPSATNYPAGAPAFLARHHQHRPWAVVVLITCLYSLFSSSPLLCRLFTSSIAFRETDVAGAHTRRWRWGRGKGPRLLAGSGGSPYLLGETDRGPDETKYYPDMRDVWFLRGWRPFAIQMPDESFGEGQEKQLRITTLGFSCQPIKGFMEECRAVVAAERNPNFQASDDADKEDTDDN